MACDAQLKMDFFVLSRNQVGFSDEDHTAAAHSGHNHLGVHPELLSQHWDSDTAHHHALHEGPAVWDGLRSTGLINSRDWRKVRHCH